ncbi:LysR family transcriptional regulator [Calidifontibacillus erzurumensis]|uniref:LysR family transcriptional regulator n=1 Tax=Calidifontibacillus erzurumensis TaxID=2741433 RepID=A0A8J8GI71_9BACI|nr:LysR family transcriptional regulator [Calidifontibacillus erzurumensis]NSL52201.1 LysR family transcriptional regulator [Calidifontibacillus erzurumensis]
MDEKDWNILQTLYEERNITKAAQRLYISQPALSYRIQALEKEFNTTIISRGQKGVEFTIQGEYLVKYSKEMLMQLRKAKEYVANLENTIKGTLRLGASGMFARYELPFLLKNFLYRYPNVDINLKTGWSSEINQMLHREEVHIGIVRGDYNWQGKKVLFREEHICVASINQIDFDELPSLSRINYQTDPSLKNQIDNWWQETYKVPPKISMEVDRIDTCKQMVLNGLGYAIFPSICVKKDEPLFTAPIMKDGKPLVRNTWIMYRENTLQLAYVRAFIDFLHECSDLN